MYYMLVACMAGPLDTGQEIATHLLFHINPIVIYQLIFLILPKDPMLLRILATTSAWRLRGHPCGACPKRIKYKQKLQTYLVPKFFAPLKVLDTPKYLSWEYGIPRRTSLSNLG
jgi:hypothetical protein